MRPDPVHAALAPVPAAGRRGAAGFTLLELLVAIALLAVLALLGWRAMGSVIAGRDAIVERSDALRAMTVAIAQLDEDLHRAWPVRLLGLETPFLTFTPGSDRSPPALALLRETPADDPAPLRRVGWRLRDGVLERGFGDYSGTLATGDALLDGLVWQPLVGGVQALEFRAWLAGRGWQPAGALSASPDAGRGGSTPLVPGAALPSAPLVTGLEMVMVMRGERLVRIFAVAD